MDIITEVINKEGPPSNDPIDAGGRTQFGISERSNPDAWADGKVTEEEARGIYEAKYVKGPRFDQIPDPHLRAHLVDFGVNSGPMIAIMKLQEILHVPVDGVIGPDTLYALSLVQSEKVNQVLVVKRVLLIGKIVVKHPPQAKFLIGWLTRALEWLT